MEYKIASYTVQSLDSRTLQPKGRKVKRWSVYKKKTPFPNKSVVLWETVKDNFTSEQSAINYMMQLKEK